MLSTGPEGVVDSVINQDELEPHQQTTRPTVYYSGACFYEVEQLRRRSVLRYRRTT
jgi:hypothetical protein